MKKIICTFIFVFILFFSFSQNDSLNVKIVKKGDLSIFTAYDLENNILSYAVYKNGKKHGKWVIKDRDLVVRYEMFYKNGEKTGIWKYYNEFGKLEKIKKFNKKLMFR